MSENKDLDEAIHKLETKHRVEFYLTKLGANAEAAALIASSPDVIKQFMWDGVNLHFGRSDLAAVDDPEAKVHFLEGPLKALFTPPVTDKANGDGDAQLDDTLVAAALAGNRTAYARLARDSFGGDVKALDAVLAKKRDADVESTAPNGGGGGVSHDKSLNGYGGSNNPFLKLRRPDGTIDKAVEAKIGGMIAAMGHRKVADIARAAKSPTAPLGLSITGVPLKAF